MGHDATAPGEWAELEQLVSELVTARSAVAEAQAREAHVFAKAVEVVVARTELRRAQGAHHSEANLPLREVSAELAAATRLSDRSVQRRMGDAAALVGDYRATLTAWEQGAIDAGHVTAILDAGVGVGDDARERYEQLVLEAARTESAGRLQSIARTIAARTDPETAAARVRARKADRQVRVVDLDDGIARLLADLPATLAYAIHDRLTTMAHTVHDADEETGSAVTAGAANPANSADPTGSLDTADPDRSPDTDVAGDTADRPGGIGGIGDKTDDPTTVTGPGPARAGHAAAGRDPRTLDQLRADILADLLLAGSATAHGDALDAITGHVQVTVPVLSLAGTSDEPALLSGYGPVDAETARRLAAQAPGWDRVLTHPHTGAVLAVDRYRPGADLTRFLRARDERCRFPGCRARAPRCDIDHTHDAAYGGPTRHDNLSHLCRRHHTLKHATDWEVRQLPGGVLEWRAPTGRRHRDRPPATVRFVPTTTDPPPF